MICFDCGMGDVKETERQFQAVLDSDDTVVIRDDLRMPKAGNN